MPIYEYYCTKCKHEFEVLQKISDKPIKKCEKCGAKTEKKMSLSGFQLKGDGWYADGYSKKKDSSKKSDKSEKSSGSASKSESAAPASDSGKTKNQAA